MQQNIDNLIQKLRVIYQKYGYSQFRMNKFEEYDTYVKNKDFLISDKVITFTDTNGKLLAMKPDVTLSIIKNSEDTANYVQKVYYNENVYRVSEGSQGFKEIMQAGLECIGEVDTYNICEVIMLAAKSLECISEKYFLDISHMGLVASLLAAAGIEDTSRFLKAISEKNLPELAAACKEQGLEDEWTEKIKLLVSLYGPIEKISKEIKSLSVNKETEKAITEVEQICGVLIKAGLKNIQFDFSVVNDMKYYNGILFRGYVEGVPAGILSGGQYDRLMTKMGRKSGAIGFAIYLNLLERLFVSGKEYDADVLLCYDENVFPEKVFDKAEEIIAGGKSVLVQRDKTAKVFCRETVVLSGEEKRS